MSTSSDELEEFHIEAYEMLDEAESKLMSLDKGGEFKPIYDAVFRVFHSLKGASGFLGLDNIQHHMHQLESQYQQLQSRGMSKQEVTYFLAGIDAARKLMEKQEVVFNYLDFEEVSNSLMDSSLLHVQASINDLSLDNKKMDSIIPLAKSKIDTPLIIGNVSPKKFFGRFLVDRGLISENELVLALIEQIKSVPPIAEIVLQEQWMTPEQVLKIFDYQVQGHCEFLSAADSLGFWNEELSRLVNAYTNDKKTMLGELLINRDLLTLDVLVDVLDDFVNTNEADIVEDLIKPQKKSEDIKNVQQSPYFIPERLINTLNELLSCDNNRFLEILMETTKNLKSIEANKISIVVRSVYELASIYLKLDKIDELERLKLLSEFILSVVWDVVGGIYRNLTEEEVLQIPENSSSLSHLVQIISEMKQGLNS